MSKKFFQAFAHLFRESIELLSLLVIPLGLMGLAQGLDCVAIAGQGRGRSLTEIGVDTEHTVIAGKTLELQQGFFIEKIVTAFIVAQ